MGVRLLQGCGLEPELCPKGTGEPWKSWEQRRDSVILGAFWWVDWRVVRLGPEPREEAGDRGTRRSLDPQHRALGRGRRALV